MKNSRSTKTRFSTVPSVNVNQDSRLGFLMHEIIGARQKVWTHAFRELELTRAQWWCLGTLSLIGQEEGIIQTDFAKIMHVKKVSMGVMIDNLEALGYVERRIDPQDGRAWRIHLSPAGRSAIVHMLKAVQKMVPELNSGISDEELEVVERVMIKMRENLDRVLAKQ